MESSLSICTYLSNQFPTTLLARIPPSCTHSLRQRASPWKMEWLVQRTSPSRVRRTLPRVRRVSLGSGQSHSYQSSWKPG